MNKKHNNCIKIPRYRITHLIQTARLLCPQAIPANIPVSIIQVVRYTETVCKGWHEFPNGLFPF
jgi:hypothetical protein